MTQRISDADLCSDLRRVADAVGGSPTVRQYREHGEYSDGTLRSRFDSWSAALEAAGLDGSDATYPIPDAELIDEIQALADELGRPPTVQAMDEQGTRWSVIYARRFGSWNAALEAAGFEPRQPQQSLDHSATREELLAEVETIAEQHGTPPLKSEMVEHGAFSPALYADRFGSWSAAVEAAGFEPHPATHSVGREGLTAALRELADELDAPPTTRQFNDNTPHSSRTAYRHFDSWEAALEAAGLDPDVPRGASHEPTTAIPEADLLADIRRLSDLLGEPPSLKEYREAGEYGAQTLYDRFGSWNAAVEAAGFDARDPTTAASKDALLAAIRRLADGDDPPTSAEMRREGPYSVTVYHDHFGSWRAALEAAGFDA
jgi:hypothetical protein